MQRSRRRSQQNVRKERSRFSRVFVIAGAVLILLLTGSTTYALQLENQDQFCASCHTQPETQYYQQSVATPPTTLAAFHTPKDVHCIDCHSGGGALGRSTGLSQGLQDLVSFYSGNYRNPAITTSPLGDDSCTKCHSDLLASADFNNHFHVFLPRWQSIDASAAHGSTCHASHPAGDPTQGYMTTAAVEKVCVACHNAAGVRE